MPGSRTIRGEIALPPDAPAFTPAHVLVEVEDISRADAPSRVVQRLQLAPGALRGQHVIPFILDLPADALDDRSLYSVRVHIDVNGSGEVEPGDYISVQTYPVLTRGYGDSVRVAVRRV